MLEDRAKVVRHELCVPENGGTAGGAHVIGRRENFLHGRASEATDCLERSVGDRRAEVEVAEDPLEWIGVPVVAGRRKKRRGYIVPMPRRRDTELVLGGEVMEERALGYARCPAELFDAGCSPALFAYE